MITWLYGLRVMAHRVSATSNAVVTGSISVNVQAVPPVAAGCYISRADGKRNLLCPDRVTCSWHQVMMDSSRYRRLTKYTKAYISSASETIAITRQANLFNRTKLKLLSSTDLGYQLVTLPRKPFANNLIGNLLQLGSCIESMHFYFLLVLSSPITQRY